MLFGNFEMRKFGVTFVSCLLLAAYSPQTAGAQEDALWKKYKADFITSDGRVTDKGQNEVSHSEGQAYGMLLALAYNDKAEFDRLLHWAKDNLGGRTDGLFAWQWGKRATGNWEPVDFNNATDGDILIAYALLRGHKKWGDPQYMAKGQEILRALRTKLGVQINGSKYLLPGYFGYAKDNGVVLNPSYLVLPAFALFTEYDQKDFWDAVHNDGLALLSKCYFGKMGLPADWILLSNGKVTMYEGNGTLFGYEAIRSILFLSLENNFQYRGGVEKILGVYEKLGYIPAFVDLKNDSISLNAAPAGFYAIYSLVERKLGQNATAKKLATEAREKVLAEKDDYYSFSLYLMATSEGIF
jgi:endo-1,4-beta-D-glucanase Y